MRVKRTRRSLFGSVAMTAAVTLTLAACGGDSGSGDDTPPATKLVVGWPTDPDSFDPAAITGRATRDSNFHLYEPLLTYKFNEQDDGSLIWDGNSVEPNLAESWTVDESTGTVTFKIREGVTFYETGNPLTSEDVRYTYERGLDMNGNNLRQAGLRDPSQFKVIDEYTIAFQFLNADGTPNILPTALPTLRYAQYLIIDSKEVKSHATTTDKWAEEWLKQNPAGTGPYYLESRNIGQDLTYQAVPNHWAGPPGFDTFTAKVTGDADMAALMKGGEVNVSIFGISNRGLDDLEANGFQVQNGGVPKIMRMDMAMDNPNLQDLRVRQAIAYAIPYQTINDSVFSGRVTRALSFTNPQATDYTPAWEGIDTDMDKAKELMADSGVAPFSIELVYDNTFSHNEDSALLIKDALADLGITVNINPQTNVQFTTDGSTRSRAGQAPLHTGFRLHTDGWWVDEAAPGISFWWRTDGIGNWAHFYNDELDALHTEFTGAAPGPERVAAFQRIQEIVMENMATVPIVNAGVSVAMAPGLTSFAFTPDGVPRMQYLKPTG